MANPSDPVASILLEAMAMDLASDVGKAVAAAPEGGVPQAVADVARSAKRVLKEEEMDGALGFAVFVLTFDVGAPGGTFAYAATGDRRDVLNLLDELRAKLAATLPPGDRVA
jgi:hypothetical protein